MRTTRREEDSRTVRGVLAGEPNAFRELMRRYNGKVFCTARSVLRDDVDAEDACQQAWLSIFVHVAQWDGRASFGAWAARITFREALRRKRARRHFAPSWELETVPVPERNPEDVVVSKDARRLVEAAIDTLPANLRAVVVLRDLADLTGPETADALNLTLEAVRVRLHRGRKQLREQLHASPDVELAVAYPFLGVRCDRMVTFVMQHLGMGTRELEAH